ncbi:MAG: single-stranded-DNA-specific exonuclease RecJ [Bacteroidota bacterium]|nr:single-stranded-DNA-specific exonuclease RecJ [Bacteroidota bacterium]
MKKRWALKEQGDEETIQHLTKKLGINVSLTGLLAQRGIKTFDESKHFFRPELSHLHSPFLMKDMHEAIIRIGNAIEREEKILIYGDYDVDGTTAVALLYTFFNSFYKNLDFYIPDRYDEGYGISYKGIDFAAKNDFKLVIAVDCGIKAVEKIDYAKEKGVDFIIADHHRPGDTIPAASAVLDPKRTDCNYPFDELSGCGVAFKIIQAYAEKSHIPFHELEKYLDLVVVSIAADVVPLTGENRTLAFYGLKSINTNPRPGFEAILKYSNVIKKGNNPRAKNNYIFNRELTISDLIFLIGPRINAAGRIKSGKNSVELLICDEMNEATEIGEQINDLNIERRALDATATEEALEKISNNPDKKNNSTTVVYDPSWHKGIVGIVASRLIESYYRPTIVFTKSNGLITGSARSVKAFDIYDAIDECSDLLEHFGGHKYAAGLSIKPENIELFSKRFEKVVSRTITEEMKIPEIEIDYDLPLKDITTRFYRILRQFAPFGPNNTKPIFRTQGVIDTGYARIVGKNHLKITVIHPKISGFPVDAIAFQQGDMLDYIKEGNQFDISYTIEENEWNGNVNLQLNIKDIKRSIT